MDKKKAGVVEDDMGINPFTKNLEIYATKRAAKLLNKFGDEDIKETELEATPYTKVFEVEGAKGQLYDLPVRSKELYLYLIHAIKSAHDYLVINKEEYMKKMGITSVNTYKSALRGLSDAGYVTKHTSIKDVLWINPHYFFKGSRLNKYPRSIVIRERGSKAGK